MRTSWLYGTGGRNFVRTILRLAGQREEIRVVSDQVGSPTWSADLARTLAVLAGRAASGEGPAYGTYHYGGEGVSSWYDLAVATVEEGRRLGMDLLCRDVVPIPTEDWPAGAPRPSYSVLDKTKIKEALGIRIPHWRASLVGMLGGLMREGAGDDGP